MTLRPLVPASFPWFPYDGFTFSLGLHEGELAWTSGHTSAALDPEAGRMRVTGTMAEQARTAYEKVLTILAAEGFGPADVVHVTENVTIAGLAHYAEAAAVRTELLGERAVSTVVVERLVRRTALLEVELHAVRGGGRRLRAAVPGEPGTWTASAVAEADGLVHLPTVIPVDATGQVVHPGQFAAQYAWCLDRAGEILAEVGLTLADAVATIDYSVPEARRAYRDAHDVRKDRLGGRGCYPVAAGILMSRLHHPGQLVALDVTATRHPQEVVNPGWRRYDTLTYAPAVRTGRTLFLSGVAALDMETQQALHPGDIGAQAEVAYGAILQVLRHAGLGPEDLVRTVEFCVESALPQYRAVAGVRERLLAPPWPASTGDVCAQLLRPEFLLEVVATARFPQEIPQEAV